MRTLCRNAKNVDHLSMRRNLFTTVADVARVSVMTARARSCRCLSAAGALNRCACATGAMTSVLKQVCQSLDDD